MSQVAMLSTISVAANSTNNNVVSGQTYERAPYNGNSCNLFSTGSAAGLTCEITVGNQRVSPPMTVNANARVPIIPDDHVTSFDAFLGQLIQITVSNTTGGALTFYWKITIEEADIVQ
jgi:hypothetical protein